MDRETARRWVAEHVMQMQRKPCESDGREWHTAGFFEGGYACENGFYCRWCDRKVLDGEAEPCPEYPFPAFDLVQLMQKLGELGEEQRVGIVLANMYDGRSMFFLTMMPANDLRTLKHVETDDPFGDLCRWLVERYSDQG